MICVVAEVGRETESRAMVCPTRESVKDEKAHLGVGVRAIFADAATGLRSASPDFGGPRVSSLQCVQVDRLELRSELRREVSPKRDGQPVVASSGGGLLLQRDAHVIGLERPHGARRRVDDEIAHAADEKIAAEIPAPGGSLE